MSPRRRAQATLARVAPAESSHADGAAGVELTFRPVRSHLGVDEIADFAALAPAESTDAALGVAKVVRLLRMARIALPGDHRSLLCNTSKAVALLERAVGTPVSLELQARSRVRFTAWTETGVESVTDVADVLEDETAYLVLRRGGRFPVRVPRENVVRQRTDCETWFEVTSIDRR